MPPNPIDFEKLLNFFQNLYAHSMTLDYMLEHYDEIDENSYDVLKPRYDQFAAEKFQMFYVALNDPAGFAKAVKDFLNMNPKNKRMN